jgi:hypothetical protein
MSDLRRYARDRAWRLALAKREFDGVIVHGSFPDGFAVLWAAPKEASG